MAVAERGDTLKNFSLQLRAKNYQKYLPLKRLCKKAQESTVNSKHLLEFLTEADPAVQ